MDDSIKKHRKDGQAHPGPGFKRSAARIAFLLAFGFRRNVLRRFRETVQSAARAESLLQQLNHITDAAPVAIVQVGRDERYVFSNRYYIEHYGRESPVGKTIREVLGAEAYDKVRPYVQRALAGELLSFESSIVRSDGVILHVNVIYAPSFDENKEVTGFVGFSEDITIKKLAALELQAIQAKNAFLLKAVSEFSKALTPTELLLTTINLCEEAFGADSAMLVIPNQARTHLMYVPKIPGRYTTSVNFEKHGIPIDSELVAAQIFRSGKAAFVGSRAERDRLYPAAKEADPEHYVEAFAGLPLSFEGQLIAGRSLAWETLPHRPWIEASFMSKPSMSGIGIARSSS
jgi:PAS domain S-box-containing protein